jgi:hypothetical protein
MWNQLKLLHADEHVLVNAFAWFRCMMSLVFKTLLPPLSCNQTFSGRLQLLTASTFNVFDLRVLAAQCRYDRCIAALTLDSA